MAKLVTYIFIVSSLILWYLLLFGGSRAGVSFVLGGVDATNGHGSQLEGRDFHHHGGSHHIRRNINHCWRRYDGYNLQNTIVNKKEQLKKPYGILCNFKCTWFFTINFPTCEYIHDYKLSCVLFTSLPDCTNVKCTLLNYFS
ncbi:hypothetical protein KR215_008239 [Drosophila sulfurigaster]|uniref:Uncharacterized protein LOC117571530 n=1 Tax=Drosophila albomicans TaxID=7291 RepID=A0A6P8XDS9_DROAB|nr:uncharacterized protein LOC117571530 [Drosophila albomicans]XP_060663478.1 uncharacterized protein LOC132796351 [Drosophila nasuta]XP_062139683.1 uncharacterized protein LOC133848219 [Drosophila sulfurigaster albostrigata]KAH8400168.1 hypothetical protein KR215_008239 [Drosophila sulfurigaster]